MSPTADTTSVTLAEPSRAVCLWVARAYLDGDGPTRLSLHALALALSWPAPPWERAAQADVDAARQELRDATAAARIPSLSAEERAEAARDVRGARLALANAEAALGKLRPALTEASAAGAWAMAQMEAAGVSPAVWDRYGDAMLARWIGMLSPPVGDIGATLDFTLPQRASDSAGVSNSPINGAATR
jgi:hypothetical protein